MSRKRPYLHVFLLHSMVYSGSQEVRSLQMCWISQIMMVMLEKWLLYFIIFPWEKLINYHLISFILAHKSCVSSTQFFSFPGLQKSVTLVCKMLISLRFWSVCLFTDEYAAPWVSSRSACSCFLRFRTHFLYGSHVIGLHSNVQIRNCKMLLRPACTQESVKIFIYYVFLLFFPCIFPICSQEMWIEC